jgi:hypothetical protein
MASISESATTLPPYAQLINEVANLVETEPEQALEFATFVGDLYPSKFVLASLAILRAQAYARLGQRDECLVWLARSRELAEEVRSGGRVDYKAQMHSLEATAKQFDAILGEQLLL